MKTLSSFFLFVISFLFVQAATAQTSRQDTFQVAGNCGMCKQKIESAATSAGATYASWNSQSKKLAVTYNPAAVSNLQVQQAVAAAGYDTKAVKATDAAYQKLHACCQYNRSAWTQVTCCDGAQCSDTKDCCKGAGCCNNSNCCAEGKTVCCKPSSECCKDGACAHHTAAK